MGGRSLSRLKGISVGFKNHSITAAAALDKEEKRRGGSHYN